ncbi:hypothetical protein I305_06261 [Cryptococcus gattii E566]|uniref:Uncharacterized protein n=2 Tax=Cryptococcus gattii TaxID=37769 RepID=E6R129_CRYGW|nr:Hypothetical protein CGB_B5810W [Cryptococcus gattii WM276]ADV20489.1 Hypothetical protein CGB_B5810W [Cryptococcus gattii WM276]KIR76908.1 hypothetical protein I306_06060 [Cryptococcus gattii EJB2]KIY31356.1 hypothetical protein I305_06261 [Cryptococcus gattii E566]
MTTRFIIPAAPSPLPPAPAPSLSLLPFSLGPAHAPYTDNHANTSQYFQPRPGANDDGQTVQATFRGRLVIGQYLAVPPAYRGLILSTSLPPNRGGTEHHPIASDAPLTPCASIDAVEDTSNGGGGRPQRSSRSRSVAGIKGAGQIALSKPRTIRTAPKKRTLLDSDDEQEDVQDGDGPRTRRVKVTTPKKNAVPEIVIQEPTPLKPLSTRPEVKEPFIPLPDTENDSPVFSIPSPPLVKHVKEEEEEEGGGGPVRILYPKAQFQGFMLYTPDGPLVGFRADELEKREQQVEQSESQAQSHSHSQAQTETQSQSQSQAQTETSLESDSRSNINLRPSWWRQGGAGEGGDEFVRGMGEWLGLVQVLNKPVYLEGLDGSDDDDE